MPFFIALFFLVHICYHFDTAFEMEIKWNRLCSFRPIGENQTIFGRVYKKITFFPKYISTRNIFPCKPYVFFKYLHTMIKFESLGRIITFLKFATREGHLSNTNVFWAIFPLKSHSVGVMYFQNKIGFFRFFCCLHQAVYLFCEIQSSFSETFMFFLS